MYSLALRAGAPVAYSITARPKRGQHRWDVRLVADDSGEVRAAYSSLVGGDDLSQRVAVPAQAMDCHLEVGALRARADGWTDSHMSVAEKSLTEVDIGFCDLATAGSRHDDVLMTFAFPTAEPGRVTTGGRAT